MLDKETKENIKYLALCKQKEQLEKEIKQIEKENQSAKFGVKPGKANELKKYFQD